MPLILGRKIQRKPTDSIFKKVLYFLISIFQYIFITIVALVSAYSTDFGLLFILALAAYVFLLGRDSRLPFGIALFLLVTIPFFQIINLEGIAENVAVYVFELLVVGTIQALIEVKFTKN